MKINRNQIGIFSRENNESIKIIVAIRYFRVSKKYIKTGMKQADITAILVSHERVVYLPKRVK